MPAPPVPPVSSASTWDFIADGPFLGGPISAASSPGWGEEVWSLLLWGGTATSLGWGNSRWSVLLWGSSFDLAALALAEPWTFGGSRMKTLKKTVGDTLDSVVVVRHRNGRAIDLSTATALRFEMQNRRTGAMKVAKALAPATYVFDPPAGKFLLPWNPADVDEPGIFWAEVEVDFANGDTIKLPNDGKNIVVIQNELHPNP